MTTNRKIQIPNFKNIQKKNLWDETPTGETMKLDNTCFVPFIEFPALLLKKLWILYQNRHNNSKSHFVGRFAQHTFVRQNKTRQSLKLVMEDSEENDRFEILFFISITKENPFDKNQQIPDFATNLFQ